MKMNTIRDIFAPIVLGATLVASGQSYRATNAEIQQAERELEVLNKSKQSHWTTKGNITGKWVKVYTSMEGGGYPADPDWKLEVTFSPDGTFVWQSTRTVEGGDIASNRVGQIDESVKGKYVMGAYLITYQFDAPSEQAMKQLRQFFAFWPWQLRGQHTFHFRDGFLRLGNDGGKTWVYLKRKDTREAEPSPVGN